MHGTSRDDRFAQLFLKQIIATIRLILSLFYCSYQLWLTQVFSQRPRTLYNNTLVLQD